MKTPINIEDLRLAIFHCFVDDGRAPEIDALSRQFDADPLEIRAALRDLARNRHVVIDADDRIVMAHPFTSIPLGFAVMGNRTLWWGGCAWDSFALPHLLKDEPAVLVSTRCPGCGWAHAWNVNRDEPPSGDHLAHFLVPAHHMWDDVVHTCGNQRIFCNQECIDRWLDDTSSAKGYVMDLTTLWRLASHWYDGRLERGYRRREPAEAVDYFAGVGLTGPFWGQ